MNYTGDTDGLTQPTVSLSTYLSLFHVCPLADLGWLRRNLVFLVRPRATIFRASSGSGHCVPRPDVVLTYEAVVADQRHRFPVHQLDVAAVDCLVSEPSATMPATTVRTGAPFAFKLSPKAAEGCLRGRSCRSTSLDSMARHGSPFRQLASGPTAAPDAVPGLTMSLIGRWIGWSLAAGRCGQPSSSGFAVRTDVAVDEVLQLTARCALRGRGGAASARWRADTSARSVSG